MGILERQLREEMILNAAAKVFFTRGFADAKMSDVAKEAKLSKGLVYFYYKNKEDLYLSVILHAASLNINFLKNTVAQKEGEKALDKLLFLLRSYFVFSRNYPFYQEAISNFISMIHPAKQTVGNEFLEMVKDNPIFQEIVEMQQEPVALLGKVIMDGLQDGSIKTKTNPLYLYMTIWSMMIGYEKLSPSEDSKQVNMGLPYKLDNQEWQKTITTIVTKILTEE